MPSAFPLTPPGEIEETRSAAHSVLPGTRFLLYVDVCIYSPRDYDRRVPNKTIYVSDADLPVFQRAQELTGGNLSAAISKALRRLVEVEEGLLEGFEEITVRVGVEPGKLQRFQGVQLVDWNRSTDYGMERYRVYRTRTGKLAVHVAHPKGFVHTAGKDGQLTGWRKHFAAEQQWGETPAMSSLEVFETFDELTAVVPAELAALVEAYATQPEVEDLDI
jgi:EXLDI family protein